MVRIHNEAVSALGQGLYETRTLSGVAQSVAEPVSAEWRPATGTHAVNADCTGSMSILHGAGPVRKLRIVIVRHGKEIRAVEETNVVSSGGIKDD